MTNNPIPFNPETMTVKELKECAETLRTLFQALPTTPPEGIVGHLTQVRDEMLRRWGTR